MFPLFSWVILAIYILFPDNGWTFFNSKGRNYLFKLFFKCMQTPFLKMEFRISWLTNMIVSFAGAFKDLDTTVCYYQNRFSGEDPNYCKLSPPLLSPLNLLPQASPPTG